MCKTKSFLNANLHEQVNMRAQKLAKLLFIRSFSLEVGLTRNDLIYWVKTYRFALRSWTA
jgi:hypothetical protein